MMTRRPPAMETLPARVWAYGQMLEMTTTAEMLLNCVPEEFREPVTRACQALLSDYLTEISALLAELTGSPVGVEQHQ